MNALNRMKKLNAISNISKGFVTKGRDLTEVPSHHLSRWLRKTARCSAKIRMGKLPNASVDRYRYSNLLGREVGASKWRGKANKTKELICSLLSFLILTVFELCRKLRRTFEPKRDKTTGGWSKLDDEVHHNLYSSCLVTVIKSTRIFVLKATYCPALFFVGMFQPCCLSAKTVGLYAKITCERDIS
jgi:hypothetical protein